MIEHESNIFDKDAYEKIKGVAILLMLAHHMYGFPDFWKIQSFTFFEEISPQFASLTKICVCIFAFLSGYGFSLKKRNLRYVISKILSVLKKYYIYYFIMLLSIICICGYRPTILEVLGDLFMTDFNVMIFCWYIPFYIISIVLLWGIYETYQFCSFKLKLPGGVRYSFLIIWFLMAYIVIYLVEYKIFYEHVIGITSFIPCMIVGFFMGKTDLFNKTYYVIKKNTKFDVIIGVVFVVASFSLRLFKPFALTFDTGCFSVPVLILGLLLSGILDNRVVGSILKYLGRLSFSIWLFHCIYFSENSNIQMQRYIYVCGSPLVNFIILLLECMLLCSLIEKIIFIFRSKINMWLKISSHC